jgi:hypothetical protein
MKKFLLIPLVLIVFILGSYFSSQNIEAATPVMPDHCQFDDNGLPVCPQWSLSPDFCSDGTITSGVRDECSCLGAPTCSSSSPRPSSIACTRDTKRCPDDSLVIRSGPNCEFAPCPRATASPTPTPTPTPPAGCFYQSVQCIQAPCNPILVCPSPSPTPSPTTHQNCQSDSDCSGNEFCYQPPMPYCPPNAACVQVMPAQYCKEKDTTSILITDNLPNQLTYLTLVVDEKPSVFNLDSTNPKVTSDGGGEISRRDGYAMGFKFNVKKGQNVDLLAKELDIKNVGSYVGTHLYGPDKKRMGYSLGSTRAGVQIAPEDATYYWIVQTFSNKEGRVQVQAYDLDKSKAKSWFVTAESSTLLNPNDGIKYLGRYEFKLQMEFPSPVTLNNDGTLEYFNHSAGRSVKEQPKLLISKDASISPAYDNLLNAIPVKIVKLSDTKIEITPGNTTKSLFKPGYYYALISQSIYDTNLSVTGVNYTAYFRASSSSVYLTADLNNDQKVNILDYTILSSHFMETEYFFADINLDGKVNLMDFTIMMGQFNQNFALP